MTAPAALNDRQRTAAAYTDRGWVVLVLPPRSKKPPGTGWQNRRLTLKQLVEILERGSHNLAVLTGPPSGGLGDTDLDTPEAAWLADHTDWLPPTPATFGRRSSPRSHRLYAVPDGPAQAPPGSTRRQSKTPGQAPPVVHAELRWGPGLVTVVPGSRHKDTGESIVWMPDPADDGSDAFAPDRPDDWDAPTPAIAGWAELTRGVGWVAAGSLLAREWPRLRRERSRHHTTNALAGGLVRAGWSAGRVGAFLEPILLLAGDEELPDRLAAVQATAATLAAGGSATGWKDLAAYLPSLDVDRLKKWLQVAPPPADPDVQALRAAAPAAQGPPAGVNGRPPPPPPGQGTSPATGSPSGGPASRGGRARVVVELGGDDLYGNTKAVLAGAGTAVRTEPCLFEYGGTLARLSRPSPGPDGAPVVETLTSESLLLNQLVQLLDFQTDDGRQGLMPVTPKAVLVRNLLAEPITAWPVPHLSRVVDTPVMTPDGRLLWADGFDRASGVYVALAPELRTLTVVPTPTRADADVAVAVLLDDVWRHFPFRAAADKANALAGALTPVLRPLIDGPTPLHAVVAPAPGVGKSFLARSIARPFAGERITEWTPSVTAKEEDSLRKEITTFLKAGHSAFLFDNTGHAVDNKVLAGALTRRRWTDRLLGGNQTGAYAIDVLWLLASNNPTFSGEMVRRTVPIVLRPATSTPTTRTDIPADRQGEGWLIAQRRRQVEALLTLVRWWQLQPAAPYRGGVLGGFEAWSCTVGAVLEAAGVPDFLANVADFRAQESDLEVELGAMIDAWKTKYGDTPVTVDELLPNVVIFLDIYDRLTAGKANPKHALGLLLRDVRGRVIEDVRVVCEPKPTKGRRKWMLLAPDAPEP